MSVAERRYDLIFAIASAYVNIVKFSTNADINTVKIMQQIIKITCTVGDSCSECVNTFLTQDEINDVDKRKSVTNPNGICGPLCSCSTVNIFQDMTVNFSANADINQPTNDELDKIVQDVIDKLNKKYDATFVPTPDDIISILNGKDDVDSNSTSTLQDEDGNNIELEEDKGNEGDKEETTTTTTSLNTVVNQALTSLQIINLEGSGIKIKNIEMITIINTLMNAIAKNSIDIVNKSVYDSVQEVQRKVQEQTQNTFKRTWNEFKNYFIILFIATGISFIIMIFTYIYQAATKKH